MLFKCGKYTDIRLFGLQQIFDVSRLKSPELNPCRFDSGWRHQRFLHFRLRVQELFAFLSFSAISLKIFVPCVLAKICICQKFANKSAPKRASRGSVNRPFCECSCVLVHNIQNHICCGIGCIHLVAVVQMRINVRSGLIG